MIARRFSEIRIGDRFGDRLTESSWHVATAAAMYYDPNPHHVNLEYARNGRFGAPVAPGFLTVGMMMGVVSRHFGWSIEALLQADACFVNPVYSDETVEIIWEVTRLEPNPKFGGGIAYLDGSCWVNPDRLAAEVHIRLALNDELPPVLGEYAASVQERAPTPD